MAAKKGEFKAEYKLVGFKEDSFEVEFTEFNPFMQQMAKSMEIELGWDQIEPTLPLNLIVEKYQPIYEGAKGLGDLNRQITSTEKKIKKIDSSFMSKYNRLSEKKKRAEKQGFDLAKAVAEAQIKLGFFQAKKDKFQIGNWNRILKQRQKNKAEFDIKFPVLMDLIKTEMRQIQDKQKNEQARLNKMQNNLRKARVDRALKNGIDPTGAFYFQLWVLGNS